MRPVLALVFAFVLGLAPGAAFAGWEATEWGMTPEQAQAAMPELKALRFGDTLDVGRALSSGPHAVNGLKGRAKLYYGPAGLEQVSVDAVKSGKGASVCPKLVQAMLDRYGQPLMALDDVIFRVAIWHDEPRQTRVRMLVGLGGELCSLHYERLATFRERDLQRVSARP